MSIFSLRSHPMPSDEVLLTLARAGRRDAQHLLHANFHDLLEHEHAAAALATLLTTTIEVASVRAYLRGAMFRGRQSQERDESRREQLRRDHGELLREQLDHGEEHCLQGRLSKDEAMAIVHAGIAELPTEQREVLELRVGGRSLPEIAARLGLPLKLVSRRNDKAIRTLQIALGHVEGPIRGEIAEFGRATRRGN